MKMSLQTPRESLNTVIRFERLTMSFVRDFSSRNLTAEKGKEGCSAAQDNASSGTTLQLCKNAYRAGSREIFSLAGLDPS